MATKKSTKKKAAKKKVTKKATPPKAKAVDQNAKKAIKKKATRKKAAKKPTKKTVIRKSSAQTVAAGLRSYLCSVCPDGRVERQLDREIIDSVIQTQGIEYLRDKLDHLADEITCPVCGAKGLVMES